MGPKSRSPILMSGFPLTWARTRKKRSNAALRNYFRSAALGMSRDLQVCSENGSIPSLMSTAENLRMLVFPRCLVEMLLRTCAILATFPRSDQRDGSYG